MNNARASYELTAKAREDYADELFDLDRIRQAIEDRAAEGYRELRVMQLHPLDLRDCTAARTLEDWLDDNEYRYAWRPIPPLSDPQYSPMTEDYAELVVFW